MYNQIIFKTKTFILSKWRGYLLIFLTVMLTGALSSCSTSFYVVRHAEKSTSPKDDPILTPDGSKRAQRLKNKLANKGIEKIYSTQTVRTITTGKPLADVLKLEIEIYDPNKQTEFIEKIKKSKQNTLVVGHSNTIRYIINGLAEKEILPKDLEDSEYSNLYLIKRKAFGKPKYSMTQF